MGRIKSNDILIQIKADLIGKDSYRGVTLTYSWMANQFGHFALGFIPATIVFYYLKDSVDPSELGIRTALYVTAFWVAFELYNFLGPLLLKKKSKSKLVYVKGSSYQFEPAWGNIAFDTFTDLSYFSIGSFTAASVLTSFHHVSHALVLNILIILILIIIYPKHYWFLTKMYEQSAQFPFQFRLSQFDLSITDTAKKTVIDWLNKDQASQHLLVFGGVNSGKTSLSVGLANEKAILHKDVFYTTATKLISLFFEEQVPIDQNIYPWGWSNCSYLVVDDINPGDPIQEDIISADHFLQLMNKYGKDNGYNQEAIRKCSVIWVLGNDDAANNLQDDWRKMLEQIGVPKDNISVIEL